MVKITEHKISRALATAIFNDDYSGLCASDNQAIEQWLDGYIRLSIDDDLYWERCEITGAYAECMTIDKIVTLGE
jgi:hypothetical protein